MAKSPYPKSVYIHNSKLYKILASPIRLEILNTIVNEECTVNELSKIIGIRVPNVSQHLAILRAHNMVIERRSGQNVYYKISNPKIVEPCKIFKDLK